MMLMHHDTMMGFAAEWVANWNQRDVEAVLQSGRPRICR
jgi:hypothetical protein